MYNCISCNNYKIKKKSTPGHPLNYFKPENNIYIFNICTCHLKAEILENSAMPEILQQPLGLEKWSPRVPRPIPSPSANSELLSHV